MAAAGAPELPFDFEFGGAYPASTRDGRLRVGIVGCGLIGQAGRRLAAGGRANRLPTTSTSGRGPCRAAWRPRSCARLGRSAGTGPDVVVVATVHDQLAELAERALDAGAHVLVEKPAGLSAAADRPPESVRATKAAAASRSGSTIAFIRRSARAAEEVHRGRHGELMYVRARYGHGGRVGYEREWRAQPGARAAAS